MRDCAAKVAKEDMFSFTIYKPNTFISRRIHIAHYNIILLRRLKYTGRRTDPMAYQNVFKRYEMKYLITQEQKKLIMERMAEHMQGDSYGRSTICNIYYDTPSYILIRNSIDRPIYKEKLRVRSYGTADENSTVFVELKKKYQSIVYKRRISLPQNTAMKYLAGEEKIDESQISREIDYFLRFYQGIAPAMFISYEREAFYAKDDMDFRLTFDENILWRDYDLSLCKAPCGTPILDENQSLMEIKTAECIPMWLVGLLSENQIYKTTFSKYGNAYKAAVTANNSGGICYA